jgi:superfamily II DNA helicase RecQ
VPGCTVVVSPLIALQEDQVEALGQADVGRAAATNSTLGAAERRDVFADLRSGSLEFLFVAPEQAPVVRQEIVDRLGLRDPNVVVHGFDRRNLRLLTSRTLWTEHRRVAVAQTRHGMVQVVLEEVT